MIVVPLVFKPLPPSFSVFPARCRDAFSPRAARASARDPPLPSPPSSSPFQHVDLLAQRPLADPPHPVGDKPLLVQVELAAGGLADGQVPQRRVIDARAQRLEALFLGAEGLLQRDEKGRARSSSRSGSRIPPLRTRAKSSRLAATASIRNRSEAIDAGSSFAARVSCPRASARGTARAPESPARRRHAWKSWRRACTSAPRVSARRVRYPSLRSWLSRRRDEGKEQVAHPLPAFRPRAVVRRKRLLHQVGEAFPRVLEQALQRHDIPLLDEIRRVLAARNLHDLDDQVLAFQHLDRPRGGLPPRLIPVKEQEPRGA